MVAFARTLFLALASAPLAVAAPPAALASALEYLRDQKSYSWEVINSDPGPVALQLETRRGTFTAVQQSTAPNMRGQIDRNGDMLIRREWTDGLKLETIITADGATVTHTPEGWLTDREILTAQAEERMRGQNATPRAVWLRRADRPDIRRPDQELTPFLKGSETFERVADGFVTKITATSEGAKTKGEEAPFATFTVTMNLRGGMIRDYEVLIEATRRATRARIAVPVSEQRIVILTYVPVNRIDIPAEAREKLQAAKASGPARAP